MITDDGIEKDEDQNISSLNIFQRHRFLVMISVSVVISCVAVFVSLSLYISSGAAQLDMSRPGYQDVRDQIESSNIQSYSSTGEINRQVIEEFIDEFSVQAKKIKSVDAFGGDPLNLKALGLEE